MKCSVNTFKIRAGFSTVLKNLWGFNNMIKQAPGSNRKGPSSRNLVHSHGMSQVSGEIWFLIALPSLCAMGE